jgi:hypothetical protein
MSMNERYILQEGGERAHNRSLSKANKGKKMQQKKTRRKSTLEKEDTG